MAKKKPKKGSSRVRKSDQKGAQLPGMSRSPLLLWGIPLVTLILVWFSALSFVPVPWPDDSAYYLAGRDFFSWPPKLIMSSLSAFVPSYGEWSFNTMPLLPILLGLGRFVGIAGAWAIKFWPLAAWMLSGVWLGWSVFKRGVPLGIAALVSMLYAWDPALRWGSVIVRPESIIGLCGVAIVLGLSLGYPEPLRARGRFWDPTAFFLAIAAYAHFNAIHLLFAVVLALWAQPRQMVRIGLLTSIYLTPWLLTVLAHGTIFIEQMKTQWGRLATPNDWLNDLTQLGQRIYPGMGVEDGWPPVTFWAGWVLWIVVAIALVALAVSLIREIRQWKTSPPQSEKPITLTAAGGWVLGAIWIFHSKPEQWFVFYFHAAAATFMGVVATRLWIDKASNLKKRAWILVSVVLVGLYSLSNSQQWLSMSRQVTWNWDTYRALIDCIDQQLIEAEKRHTGNKPFHVFGPTYPDILVELSIRHPHWGLTRTNDFWEAADRAVQHGREVDALVVTEMYSRQTNEIDGPANQFQGIESVWMQWQPYYLNRLYKEPGWKPRRWICQRGRIQAFLFMN